MENRVEFYAQCVKRLLTEYTVNSRIGDEIVLVFDEQRHHYIALNMGWHGERRIHYPLIHIEVTDERVVIQANNTEELLDDELMALGVPKNKIRLGFLPSYTWSYREESEEEAILEPA